MVNQLQFTQPQAYSGGVDFSPLERLGYALAAQQQEAQQSEEAYRLMGGGQGQGQPQGGGFFQDLGRRFGLIPEQAPGAPPARATAPVPTSPQVADGSGIGTMTPNAKKWFDYAIRPVDQGGLGLSQAQAAGKVANLQAESTPNIIPWGETGDQGTAQGSAQWREGRLRNLVEFSRAKGLDYKTTEAQQAFMRHEYLGNDPQIGNTYGGGSEGKAYAALSATRSPEQAAAAVDRYYERSSGSTRGRREAGAARLAGQTGAPIVAQDSGPNASFQATPRLPAGLTPPPDPNASPLDNAPWPQGNVGAPPPGAVAAGEPAPPLQTAAVPAAPVVASDAPEAKVAQNLVSGQPAAAAGVNREQLAQMYRNPLTRPLATAILQKQLDPGTWSYQQVGDKLIAANSRTGETKVVMEDTKPLVVGGSIATRDPSKPGGYAFHTPPVADKPFHLGEDQTAYIPIPGRPGEYAMLGGGSTGGKISREIKQRTDEALAKGYPQETADYYGMNGKLPKDDLSAKEVGTLTDNQKMINAGKMVLDNVSEMKKLSPEAWSGKGATERAAIVSAILPAGLVPKGATNTEVLGNLALQNVAGQAKAMFGARLAFGEVKLLEKIETSPNMSRATREAIYPQIERIINRHNDIIEAENEAIRNKTYKKPGGGPTHPSSGPAANSDPLGYSLMPDIAEVRQKFPQYNDMSDTELAGALHKKFYSDLPEAEFNAKIGLKPASPEKPGVGSELYKAFSPTEIAREVGRTASEGLQKVQDVVGGKESRGAIGTGPQGITSGWGKTASAATGAIEVPFSPIIGTARNIGGHLLTAAEMAAGRGLSALTGKDLTTKEPSPEAMYDVARGDVDTAAMAARPGGAPARLPILPGGPKIGPFETPGYYWQHPTPKAPVAPTPPPQTPLQEMATRAGVELPRAITGTPFQQQTAQTLAKQTAVGGGQIGTAIENVPVQLARRRGEIAAELGPERLPENVGADIRSTLTEQATAEEAARKTAAQTAYENAKRGWENTTQQRDQQIQDLEAQSARETGAQVGPQPTTTGMGEHIIDTVRAEHDALRARKNAEYADAGSREGTIYDPAIVDVRREVHAALTDEALGEGIKISPTQMPVANEMMDIVTKYVKQARKRLMEGEQTGQSLKDVEEFRKDLNRTLGNADLPADQRAASRIMQGVDRWQESAMGGPHYEGDLTALAAMKKARASNTELMNRFGYNHRFDEDKITQRIIRGGPTEHIGPNEIAKMLHDSPDKAGRVLDRVFEATGPNSDLQQSIRGGMYSKATETIDRATGGERSPKQIAVALRRLTSGTREGLAGRIYQPEDIALIRRHADAIDAAQQARDLTPKIAKATEPKLVEPVPGPAQQLAKAVIGGGQKGDEALVRQILGYATSKGSPADIRKLADTLRNIPENLKKNVLNTFIRQLGQDATGKFSPKLFADQWERHISSRAKDLLTGSGSHARTLDDLAGIARQYDEVHRKFGNPSGSGHTINFAKSLTTMASLMASGTVLGPVATIGGWLGVAGYSRFLAAPAGAASAAKFARQMAKFQSNPTVAQAGATRLAARNVRNTAVGLGLSVASFPDPGKK